MRQSGETGFWVVQKGDTLSNIVRKAFRITDGTAVANKVNQLVRLNPHIKNPNFIHARQVINLGTGNAVTVEPVSEADLLAAQELFAFSNPETDLLLNQWPTIHGISSTPGVSDTPSSSVVLPSQDAIKWAMRVAKAGLKTSNHAASGLFGNLLKVNPHHFESVEGALVRALKSNVRYVDQGSNVLKLVAKESRAFQIGGKVIIVKPSPSGGLYAFSRSVKDAKFFAKYIAKPAGTAFKFIDVGMYGYNVYQAMGTPEQNRTISRETGKLAAGLLLGGVALPAANGVCAVLTLTTGLGGVACYFTVFVAVSYGTSKLGDYVGDSIYRTSSGYTVPVYSSPTPQLLVP